MIEPDLQLCGLSIWVKDRPYPDGTNHIDLNWLEVRATMQSAHASVTIEGPILMTRDFERFRVEVASINEKVAGEASLSGYDPNLKVTLQCGSLGQIGGEIEITPYDHSESHRFEIGGLDQTHLPALITALDRVMDRFPVLSWPEG
jgi:hypothetical protein